MADTNVNEVLNLDQKVTIKNIAGWNVGFSRIDGIGDVNIVAEGTSRLSRGEIISQIQNGNKLFTGIDGAGSHATLFIEDDATRLEVDFDKKDEEDSKKNVHQCVFNDDVIKKLFGLKTQTVFEKNFKEAIVTRAEKFAVIQAIKRLKLNDYSKIRFIEDYTGFKMQ